MKNNEIDSLFNKKKNFHYKQAKLSIEEKIGILIELQKIYIIVQKSKGRKCDKIVWKTKK